MLDSGGCTVEYPIGQLSHHQPSVAVHQLHRDSEYATSFCEREWLHIYSFHVLNIAIKQSRKLRCSTSHLLIGKYLLIKEINRLLMSSDVTTAQCELAGSFFGIFWLNINSSFTIFFEMQEKVIAILDHSSSSLIKVKVESLETIKRQTPPRICALVKIWICFVLRHQVEAGKLESWQ